MGLWPEVQRKAQEELDAVVGHNRLPTYADIARMPYLNAIYLETLRWNLVVPLGESFIFFHRLPCRRKLIANPMARRRPRHPRGRLLRGIFHPKGEHSLCQPMVRVSSASRPSMTPTIF